MSERNNKLELLGSAPIPKALMALGVPIMIGMLIIALYNLVDAYFVSGTCHLIGSILIASSQKS